MRLSTLPPPAGAAVLSLLSRLLLREVDDALLEQLGRDEIAAALDDLAPGAADAVRAAREDTAAREALDVEYCRLFVLPGGVPPLLGVWAGDDREALLERAARHLQDLALRPGAHDLGRLPLDHVGVLLALAAVALERSADDAPGVGAVAALRPAARAFAARLSAEAASPLYVATARLLENVLA